MNTKRTPSRGERTAFGGSYDTHDVSRLLGLSAARVRAYVRDGFLEPRRGPRGEYRFSFQDLVVLRTAKALLEQLPARKVKRALGRLREQLPRGRELSGVRITAEGDHVIVRDGNSAWIPESGQALLNFDVSLLASEVAPLVRKAAEAARVAEPELGADDWYALACDLEACDPEQARDAYRRALELDPLHFDARLNAGRLLHELGELESAESHYRLALRTQPGDCIACFNLGVALEDLQRPEEALLAYQSAIASDPACADAHYNLARLCERLQKPRLALRHLQIYRKLTQEA